MVFRSIYIEHQINQEIRQFDLQFFQQYRSQHNRLMAFSLLRLNLIFLHFKSFHALAEFVTDSEYDFECFN